MAELKRPREQQLLRNARREGLIIMVVWAVALLWSVGSGYWLGYYRDPQTIRLIAGIPDWIFWSVVLPWGICLVFTVWFCFGFMADDDLGVDQDEGAGA
jgi:hypothetical protein